MSPTCESWWPLVAAARIISALDRARPAARRPAHLSQALG